MRYGRFGVMLNARRCMPRTNGLSVGAVDTLLLVDVSVRRGRLPSLIAEVIVGLWR